MKSLGAEKKRLADGDRAWTISTMGPRSRPELEAEWAGAFVELTCSLANRALRLV